MKRVPGISILLGVALSFPAATYAGKSPSSSCTSTEPAKQFSQLLDNHSMRLLEMNLEPGEATEVHAHPEHRAYAATHATLRISTPDGKTEEVKVKPGDLLWTNATNYKTANIGQSSLKVVVLEEKKKGYSTLRNFFRFFLNNRNHA